MSNKTPVSKADSYEKIGEFWDESDSTEYGGQKDVEFTVDIQSQKRYYAIDSVLSKKIKKLAIKRGISEETLLNLWVREKIEQFDIF